MFSLKRNCCGQRFSEQKFVRGAFSGSVRPEFCHRSGFFSRFGMCVLVLMLLVVFDFNGSNSAADDRDALVNTLKTLCKSQQEKKFMECCETHHLDQIVFEDENTWSCFFSSISLKGDCVTKKADMRCTITKLFAFKSGLLCFTSF